LMAIRSRYNPDRIDAQVGDELTVHVTNVEQTRDMMHGFGLIEHNINMVMDPGETKTFHIKLTKTGVFPYYCTNFCSALHQEMQGYLVVANAGQTMPGAVYTNWTTPPPAPPTPNPPAAGEGAPVAATPSPAAPAATPGQ